MFLILISAALSAAGILLKNKNKKFIKKFKIKSKVKSLNFNKIIYNTLIF